MAFGVTKDELAAWKKDVAEGRIAFLTHFWLHPKFPGVTSVTKVGCSDLDRLRKWAISHGLPPQYIHHRDRYPHYDIFGEKQAVILEREEQWEQLRRFVTRVPASGSSGTSEPPAPSDL